MKKYPEPFYITTAIAYPNGEPHLGHLYEAVLTDGIARGRRLAGYDVYFQTGTDEHGQKMLQTAATQGGTPRQIANIYSGRFRHMYDRLNISYDRFIRTTEPSHYEAAQALWNAMKANGDIYTGTYAGWYSVRDERYFDESETYEEAQGPRAGQRNAIGTGNPVEWLEEETYFFKLSRYRYKLLDWLQENPEAIVPERAFNEMSKLLEGELKDISISRTKFKWGVPVPGDSKHVMYVWVDALANYLTGAGYPNADSLKWPADVHVIGKDITRFHAIYWPAMLMSAKLPLPKQILSHGFILDNGLKLSKSDGTNLPLDMFLDNCTTDGLRYYLLKNITVGNDGSFDWATYVAQVNADLANNVGNLVSRVFGLILQYHSTGIPDLSLYPKTDDRALTDASAVLTSKVSASLKRFETHKALEQVMDLATLTNQYIQTNTPWLETCDIRRGEILLNSCNAIRSIAISLLWATPNLAEYILDMLDVPVCDRNFSYRLGAMKQVFIANKPKPIFNRLT